MFIVMTVDIVMGPLVTFAVFDIRKPSKELRKDLTIIVMLQVLALGGGLYTVFMARPAVLAFEVDRFRVTTAVAVAVEEFERAPKPFRSLTLTGPLLVSTRLPVDQERLDAVVKGAAGLDLGSRPSYWQPWDAQARASAVKAGKPLPSAPAMKSPTPEMLDAIARTGRPADQLLYIPMLARRTDWSVLIDKTTGDVVGFVPLDGF